MEVEIEPTVVALQSHPCASAPRRPNFFLNTYYNENFTHVPNLRTKTSNNGPHDIVTYILV